MHNAVKIDAHQHFWQFDPVRDSWINDDMSVIRRDFMPEDLLPVLQDNSMDGCVAVQADQSLAQNDFLLKLAGANSFIKGVVGWVDLQADDIEGQLQAYADVKILKGFRHVLQGEEDRALMLKPAFKRGISNLEKFGFSYDILIYTDQLTYAAQLARLYPNQRFVLDHIAKPDIKNGIINDWAKDINELADAGNVWCKVSGMVTEADWNNWQQADFTPYLDMVFEAFGAEKIMYGSDWPVCNVAGGYKKTKEIVANYIAQLSVHEQDLVWGANAVEFYKL